MDKTEELQSYTDKITQTFNDIRDLVVEKNKNYGNSVFKPVSMFGDEIIPASTAIKARISDKWSRISNRGLNDKTEDTLDDLIGYLVLLKITINENK
jgi:hypothetical protein